MVGALAGLVIATEITGGGGGLWPPPPQAGKIIAAATIRNRQRLGHRFFMKAPPKRVSEQSVQKMKTGPPRGLDRTARLRIHQLNANPQVALKRILLLQPCIGVVTGTGGRAQSACELRSESITWGSRAQWRFRK